jgi:hypothetical protein
MLCKRLVIAGFTASAMIMSGQTANAAAFVDDTWSSATAYYGGLPTKNYSQRDVIGNKSVFEILSMEAGRIDASTVVVRIETDYVGHVGNLNTYFGDLLIHKHQTIDDVYYGWSPTDPPPHYSGDEFTPLAGGPYGDGSAKNEWNFAVLMDRTGDASSGTSISYSRELLAISDNDIVTSDDEMAAVGQSGYVYRANQAVSVERGNADPDIGGTVAKDNDNNDILVDVTVHNKDLLTTDPYLMNASRINHKIIQFLIHENGTFGDAWAASWAMTCSNDIVQVDLDNPDTKIPEPAALFLFSAGLLGLAARRRRARA